MDSQKKAIESLFHPSTILWQRVQSYTSIWTVRGLRLKDTAEAFIED
jgi:hypothetical protein